MTIHTFGDSHCVAGWSSIPGIQIHHLGPKLCFSIGRDGINIDVNPEDTVIFCFGEIDCRCHIHKYISQNNDYKQIIDEIINNYFIQIQKAVGTIKTVIYNVVPPIKKPPFFTRSPYPFLGMDNERKEYVLYFNKKLKEKCTEYNFLFFDVYDKYVDANGFLNRRLSDGNVHIQNEIHLRDFIEKNLEIFTTNR